MRRGTGRIRHFATPTLRVQKLTHDGKIKITKILGVSNPADLGTEHLVGGSIGRTLESCHCCLRVGRSGIALRSEAQELTKSHPEVFPVDEAM